jgi:hypothetical protein
VKPPFRLLVRAINPDGSPAGHIRFAVSEAFVVRGPRAAPVPLCTAAGSHSSAGRLGRRFVADRGEAA